MSLLYLANESSDYDSEDGIVKIIKQNKNEIGKLNYDLLKNIKSDDVEVIINSNNLDEQIRQINAMHAYFDYNQSYFVYSTSNVHYIGTEDYYTVDVICKDASGFEKIVATYNSGHSSFCGQIRIYKNRIYYNDFINHSIRSCNMDGSQNEVFYSYDKKYKLAENYHAIVDFVFSGTKMILTTMLTDYGVDEIGIIDMNDGKYVQIHSSDSDTDGFSTVTYAGFLYYTSGSSFEKNSKLHKVDLENYESEIVDIDISKMEIVGIYEENIYLEKITNSRTSYFYKLNLNTLEISELGHAKNDCEGCMFIFDDNIYAMGGTGAGNWLAKCNENTFDSNLEYIPHKGSLSDEIGIYNNQIICKCWDTIDGKDYGYQPIYNLE